MVASKKSNKSGNKVAAVQSKDLSPAKVAREAVKVAKAETKAEATPKVKATPEERAAKRVAEIQAMVAKARKELIGVPHWCVRNAIDGSPRAEVVPATPYGVREFESGRMPLLTLDDGRLGAGEFLYFPLPHAWGEDLLFPKTASGRRAAEARAAEVTKDLREAEAEAEKAREAKSPFSPAKAEKGKAEKVKATPEKGKAKRAA